MNFISVRDRDSYYVFPSDVMDLVSSGRMDKGLFDVAYLPRTATPTRRAPACR